MLDAAPPSRREAVVDVLHGRKVADPYRWLEDGESAEVASWVTAQNERTRKALDARPDRAVWHERLVALLGRRVSMGVQVAGPRVFALERGGGQNQFVLVARPAHENGPPSAEVLLDPSGLADDATAAIDWYHPSRDGALVAYGLSEGGDEQSTLRVLDVTGGRHLADEIPHTRAASVAWEPDGQAFFYTRYPDDDQYNRRVFHHRLGAPWADDELVWHELPNPQTWADVTASPDGRYVLVAAQVGWSRTDLHLRDEATKTWRTLISGVDVTTGGRFDGDRLVAVTTLGAERGRVVAIPLDVAVAPEDWTTLVPESAGVVQHAEPVASGLLVMTTVAAAARLTHHRRDGSQGEVALPELCAVTALDGTPDSSVAYVQLEGFTRPPSLFRWEGGETLAPFGEPDPDDAAEVAFTVEHEQYRSKDGTEIGLFLVHREDEPPDADTPCILTGYGGFAIAETPAWSPTVAAWAEAGGLFAVAGLRGGYEEGEAWHQAGRGANKQNVFDDFHAAADHLVLTRRTSRDRLAIRGGSNGGLLVGAATVQRPDLCRAVHCAVPLLDMVRFPQFLIARLWTDEYGDPDVPEELAWLLEYSPYHHVDEGTCYPAVLLTTAEGDSRVDPLHARKMAAALQWASACQHERPILLHQEERAGHGVGKPVHKQADEVADVLAFFTWQLGVLAAT